MKHTSGLHSTLQKQPHADCTDSKPPSNCSQPTRNAARLHRKVKLPRRKSDNSSLAGDGAFIAHSLQSTRTWSEYSISDGEPWTQRCLMICQEDEIIADH